MIELIHKILRNADIISYYEKDEMCIGAHKPHDQEDEDKIEEIIIEIKKKRQEVLEETIEMIDDFFDNEKYDDQAKEFAYLCFLKKYVALLTNNEKRIGPSNMLKTSFRRYLDLDDSDYLEYLLLRLNDEDPKEVLIQDLKEGEYYIVSLPYTSDFVAQVKKLSKKLITVQKLARFWFPLTDYSQFTKGDFRSQMKFKKSEPGAEFYEVSPNYKKYIYV